MINPFKFIARRLRGAAAELNRAHLRHTCTYWDSEVVRLGQAVTAATDNYIDAIAARSTAYDALERAEATTQPQPQPIEAHA